MIKLEQVKDFPRLNLNKYQVIEILNKYYSGIQASVLEQEYNFKQSTISYIRKKLSLPKYQNPKFTDDYVGQAVNDLINGMLLKDVKIKYDISEPTIKRYMLEHNINYKSDHGRKNHFNKSFFNNIDTEHKAYWLGFIYADGSIGKTDKTQTTENRLSINISAKDIELLYKFAESINYNNPKIQVYKPNESTYGTNDMCRIYLNSVELVNDLKNHGIKPNKTINGVSFPFESMHQDLYKHFIRGFFDGDGCISIHSRENSFGFSIIGEKDILLSVQQILMSKCNLNKTKLTDYPHKSFEIYDLRYGGRLQVQRIFNYLYSDATIYLERKYNKFSLSLS